jgi:SAM-dependent methyltransferase
MNCGTVQIKTIPDAKVLADAYPEEYRSVYKGDAGRKTIKATVSEWVRRLQDRSGFAGTPLFGLTAAVRAPDTVSIFLSRLRGQDTTGVLDVGCGAGQLLDRLALAGVSNLLGVDPYMPPGYHTARGVAVLNIEIDQAPGQFDAIIFNHSLEHVPDIEQTLVTAHQKLKHGGICFVRIPTVSSDAWREFGVLWSQLDAPRHIVVPSRDGMKTLAERCGFELERTIDDSTGYFQFYASEIYKKGLSLLEGQQHLKFSNAEMKAFDRRAWALNKAGRGDQVAFILRAR